VHTGEQWAEELGALLAMMWQVYCCYLGLWRQLLFRNVRPVPI